METAPNESPAGPEPRNPVRILVVDDEMGMRSACEKVLHSAGFEVVMADNGLLGLEIFRAQRNFDAALIDLKMPKMNGMELIEKIRELDEDVVLLIITAYATIDTAVEATKRGAYSYIPKPFTPEELLLPVRHGLERRALAIEARTLRAEREKQRRELAEAKANFVSMVAHEVKNPLAAIEGFLNLVLDGTTKDDPAATRDVLERAQSRARNLRQMVSELLSLRAIETGNFSLTRVPLDLPELLDGVVHSFVERAKPKRITLTLDAPAPPADSHPVLADRSAMVSVFTNLVDNAIKYTPEGGCVTVRLAWRRQQVEVAVTDSGIGMTADEQAALFHEFFRVRNEFTANVHGTGLGLAIVKRLLDLHHATIAVAGAPGTGSTFTVALPLL